MTSVELLKKQYESARWLFENTVADIKPEQLHTLPGGKALPLGATYAHLLFSEDIIINALILGGAPLFATAYNGKTGVSKPMPAMDSPDWPTENEKWANSVKIDLKQIQAYQKAVFKATEACLAKLKDKDLDREILIGGLGNRTVLALLSDFVIGHTHTSAGELAVLKGIQGVKGLPM